MLFIEITPSNRFHNIYSSQYWLDKEKRIFQRNRSILHVPLMKIVLTAVSFTVNKKYCHVYADCEQLRNYELTKNRLSKKGNSHQGDVN